MKYFLVAFVLILFISCNDDQEVLDYLTLNEQEIVDYINEHDLDAQRSASGLYYIIDEEGSGDQPTSTSNVTVAYKGYFTSGQLFEQSDSNGISFGLQQVIAGWTEGIQYLKEGGSGVLLIPSHLGYGSQGRSTIPGGAVIIFDIDLISVN